MSIPTPNVPPHLLPKRDVDYVSALTALSQATVRRRCAIGEFPHSRFGNAIRFSDHDIALILGSARRGEVSETPVFDDLASSATV